MEKLINRLRRIMRLRFPGCTPELEHARPLRKVGGFLIWRGFQGVEQIDRQRRLAQALGEELTDDERARVTTILAVTPDEVAVMRAG